MQTSTFRRGLGASVLFLMVLVVPTLYGISVQQMSLTELCDHADKIVRATVVDVSSGTVQVGGAELPTTTYKLAVSDVLKGEVAPGKDGLAELEVTMLGSIKPQVKESGGLQSVPVLSDLPTLETGGEYLLMTTAPSTAGLSTTIGLGQGCFSIFHDEKSEMAVNLLNNQGLFDGPVEYSVLAGQITSALAQ